jgi:hypothetical protein
MGPEEAVEAGYIWVEGSRKGDDHEALARCLRMLEPVAAGSD